MNARIPLVLSLLVAVLPLHAQSRISSRGPDGKDHVLLSFGSTVCPETKDGGSWLGDCALQFTGEYVVGDKGVLITSGPIRKLSATSVQIAPNETSASFSISGQTKVCSKGRPIPVSTLKQGSVVTVTTRIGSQTALSIRNGPVLFKIGEIGGPMKLQEYGCVR